MTAEEPIFGRRATASTTLSPEPQELFSFLEHTEKSFIAERHAADLVRYRRQLLKLESFEKRSQALGGQQDPAESAFFGVLERTRLFNPALLQAAGEFKYHLHRLAGLDFDGPAEFIAASGEQRKKLNPRKIDDALRLVRIDEMAAERRKMLDDLAKRWDDLATELLDILRYVRDNLSRIERRCRRTLAVLSEKEQRKVREGWLIDAIKAHFKARLTSELRVRKVTKAEAEQAKEQAQTLVKELLTIVADDAAKLAGLIERVLGHVQRSAAELDVLLSDAAKGSGVQRKERVLLFRKGEQALVGLVADYPEELDKGALQLAQASSPVVTAQRQ